MVTSPTKTSAESNNVTSADTAPSISTQGTSGSEDARAFKSRLKSVEVRQAPIGTDEGEEVSPKSLPTEQSEILSTAEQRISRRVNEYRTSGSDFKGLSQQEAKLAREDPVTLAFIQELGAEIDLGSEGISTVEAEIGRQDAVTYALLQVGKIKIKVGDSGVPVVTRDGQSVHLDSEQNELFTSGDYNRFAGTLLAKYPVDETVSLTALASARVRIWSTLEIVKDHIKGGDGTAALHTIRKNMDAALSPQERKMIWQTSGEQYFTQEWFGEQIKAQINAPEIPGNQKPVDFMAGWLKKQAEAMPPEAASAALSAIMQEFREEWLAGKMITSFAVGPAGDMPFEPYYDRSNGTSLFKAISALVERTPEHGEKVSAWMSERDGGGKALLERIGFNGFSAVIDTASDGTGIGLSEALKDDLSARAKENPGEEGWLFDSVSKEEGIARRFQKAFDKASEGFTRHKYLGYASKMYSDFNTDPDKVVKPIFENLLKDKRILQDIPLANLSHTALRNLIGRSMGFIATNLDAARSKDNSVDWYPTYSRDATDKSPEARMAMQIDLIAGWIETQKEKGATLKAIPITYASELAGVSVSSLFELKGADGDTLAVIDGIAARDILHNNGWKGVKPDANVDTNWKYPDMGEFFDDNLRDPDGEIYMAQRGSDGEVTYKKTAAAIETAGEKWMPWVGVAAGGAGMIGGILLAVPSFGASLTFTTGGASLAATSLLTGAMAYGTYASIDALWEMSSHGRDIGPSSVIRNAESRAAWLGLASIPLVAVAGIGNVRSAAFISRSAAAFAGNTEALTAEGQMLARSAQLWSYGSRTAGFTDFGVGVEQLGEQGYMLQGEWEHMTPEQRIQTVAGLGTGIGNMGVGFWSGRANRQRSTELQAQQADSRQSIHTRVAIEMYRQGENIKPHFGEFFIHDGNDILAVGTGANRKEIILGKTEDRPSADAESKPAISRMTAKLEEIENNAATKPGVVVSDRLPLARWVSDRAGDVTRRLVAVVDADSSDMDQQYIHFHKRVKSAIEADPNPDPSVVALLNSLPGRAILMSPDRSALIRSIMPHGTEKFDHDSLVHPETYDRRASPYRPSRFGPPELYHPPVPKAPMESRLLPYSARTFLQDSLSPRGEPQPGFKNWAETGARRLLMQVPHTDQGDWFEFALQNSGPNTRMLTGFLNYFSGGDSHYSNPAPAPMNPIGADRLDGRMMTNFYRTYDAAQVNYIYTASDGTRHAITVPGAELAAKVDLALTGYDFSENPHATHPVDYDRKMLLDHYGLSYVRGELTGRKENVDQGMGRFAWTAESSRFREFLEHSAETGALVSIHYDLGKGGIDNTDYRISPAKTNYENFDELVSVLEQPQYRNLRVLLAHTGLGRAVRPNDEMVTATVNIRDIDTHRITETREVTAPLHIHKLYELFDRVPGARADLAWQDVVEGFSNSPELREALADFVLAYPDRLMWGSDSVLPDTQAYFNGPLNSFDPIVLEIFRRDPSGETLWKLFRANYADAVNNAQTRVREWVRGEYQQAGRTDDIMQMDKMHDTLNYYRGEMDSRARQEFEKFIGRLKSAEEEGLLGVNEGPETGGVYKLLYDTHPESKGQHADGDAHAHDGTYTSGGESQVNLLNRVGAGLTATGLAGAGYAVMSQYIMGNVTNTGNMSAFATRSFANLLRANLNERFRAHWKSVLGRKTDNTQHEVTIQTLNRLSYQIVRHQKALGFSDVKILRVLAAMEQYRTNYAKILDTPVSTETGFTAQKKHEQLVAETGRMNTTVSRELGLQPASIGEWGPKTGAGQVVDALALGTLLINDTGFYQWMTKRLDDIDFTSPHGIAETAFMTLFGTGNLLLTGYTTASLAGGLNKVNLQKKIPMMRIRQAFNNMYTAAGAAWTAKDFLAYFGPFIEGYVAGEDVQATSAMLVGAIKVYLDGKLTGTFAKQARAETARLNGGDMPEPRDLYVITALIAGLLATRTTLEAFEPTEIMDVVLENEDGQIPGENEPTQSTPVHFDDLIRDYLNKMLEGRPDSE